MGKKRTILLVILGGLASGMCKTEAQVSFRSSLDSELNLEGGLFTRWLLDLEQARFLFLEQRRPEEEPYRVVGFNSPSVSLGPMDLKGLLREAGSPLGYTLSGTVFREQASIQLYEGREVQKRIGIRIAGPDRGLSLGGYKDAEGTPHIFTTFHMAASKPTNSVPLEFLGSRVPLPFPVPPGIEGFLSLTDIEARSRDLEWFPSQHPVLPGPLLHGGTRVQVGVEGPLEGSLTLSIIGSRPAHEVMGVVSHLYGELACSWVEVKALSGYCTPHYVTPNGYRTTKEVQHAGGVTVFPIFPFFLSLEGEEVGFRDREVERSFRMGGGVWGATYKLGIQREEKGEQVGWTVEGWGRVGRFYVSLTACREEIDRERRSTLSVRGNFSSAGWEGELWGRGIWNPAFQVEGGASFSLKSQSWKVGIGVELRKPLGFRDEELLRFSLDPLAYVGASLFFSAYESHLPRNRISGSRVRP